MRRIEVLDEHVREPRIRWQMPDQFRKSFETAGGRANPDDSAGMLHSPISPSGRPRLLEWKVEDHYTERSGDFQSALVNRAKTYPENSRM
jgi:hypothetical protein